MTTVYFDTEATNFGDAIAVRENYAAASRKLAEAHAGARVLRLTLPNGRRITLNVEHVVGVSE